MVDDLESALEKMGSGEEKEETIMKAIDQLFNKDDIELKTEVKDSARISLLKGLKQELERDGLTQYKILLEDFIENYLNLQVSKDRQSRKEVVEVLKDQAQKEEEPEKEQLEKLLERR